MTTDLAKEKEELEKHTKEYINYIIDHHYAREKAILTQMHEPEPDLNTIRECVHQHIVQMNALDDKINCYFGWLMFYLLIIMGILTYVIFF